jgi:hypothetical protein
MKTLLAALLAVLIADAALAETLADMRAALAGMKGTRPIHVTVEMQQSRKSEGRFANQQYSGAASVDLVSDAEGLRVSFPLATLERAAKESRDHENDPRKATPTRSTINDMQPTELADMLDFSEPFLHLLAVSTKISESRAVREGKPVRVLVLKVVPKLPPEATSVWNVKFSEDRMTVWVGDDNVPVAAERIQRGSAGFLFIKGSMSNRQSWLFARQGDRLLVTRSDSAFVGSGFGQRGEGRNIETLTVR